MSTKTDICNMALSIAGVGYSITDLDTEKSQEANACRVFYELSLDSSLSDHPWSFATKFLTLSLIEEDPTAEWGYSYGYPNDCVYFRRILSGTRIETRQTLVPYRVAQGDSGKVVLTDAVEAVAEYTKRTTDVYLYPSYFIYLQALKLATLIVPRLSKGDPFKIGQEIQKMYYVHLSVAKALDLNEEAEDEAPNAEMIRAREEY